MLGGVRTSGATLIGARVTPISGFCGCEGVSYRGEYWRVTGGGFSSGGGGGGSGGGGGGGAGGLESDGATLGVGTLLPAVLGVTLGDCWVSDPEPLSTSGTIATTIAIATKARIAMSPFRVRYQGSGADLKDNEPIGEPGGLLMNGPAYVAVSS